MAMTAFELVGLLTLNSQAFDKGLSAAKTSASTFGSKVLSGFSTIAKVGTATLGVATAGATAFAKSAVAAGSAFDTAMGGVAATMGKSVDDMEADVAEVDTAYGRFSGTLRDFAIFMGQNTTFSATQAAGALNYMALAGYNASESMQMLPSVLSMAAAGSMDLALASDMITDTQSALGLSFERTSQMVNVFAKAAATGNTNVEQLGEAFLRVGGLARELNGGMITLADGTLAEVDGVQELEIAFTAMANAGIKGGEAGTHMRNMLLKLSNPTKDGAKALEAMGVAVFDAAGNMQPLSKIFEGLSVAMGKMTQAEKLTVIGDLFNARDTASAEALLSAVTTGWDEIGESILAADGAADQMSKTKLNNLTGDITLFRSALEAAYITLNDKLSPTLREFVQFGSSAVQKVTGAFQEGGLDGAMSAFGEILADGLNMVIEKIPMFVDAGAKLLSALGKGLFENLDVIIDAGVQVAGKLGEVIINAVPKLIDAGLKIVEALLNTLDSNFDNIMAMIGSFIKAIAKTLVNHAPTIFKSISSILMKMVDFVISNIPTIISTVANIVGAFLAELSNHQGEFLTGATEILMALVDGIIQNLPMLIDTATQVINFLVNNLISNLPLLINMAVSLIMALANGITNNLPMLLESAVQIVESLISGLVDNIPMLMNASLQLVQGLFEFIVQNLPLVLEAGLQIILALINGLVSALPDLVGFLPEVITTMVLALFDNLPMILEMGGQILKTLAEGIANLIPQLFDIAAIALENFVTGIIENANKIKLAAVEMWEKLQNTLSEKIEGAKSWGKDLIDNFISGIKEKWDKLKSTISDVGGMIKDFLGFSEPKKGPLSNFHTYAPDMMNLFMQGIKDNELDLQNTVSRAFDFSDLIEKPKNSNEDLLVGTENAENGTGIGTMNVYINQPVKSPSDIARVLREEAQYGLFGGEEYAY